MTWTDVFGGTAINPTDTLYRDYSILVPTQLEWPGDTATTGYVFADIMNLSAKADLTVLIMPDASKSGPGAATLINNTGSYSIVINRYDGVAIVTIQPGQAYFVVMYSNAGGSTAGGWWALQFGAGTSAAQASQLASNNVISSGATLVQAHPVSSISSNYGASTTDRAAALLWTGGAGTITLDSAATVGTNWFTLVRNSGSGALAIAVTGGSGNTIDGVSSITLNPGNSTFVVCDGSDFYTIGRTGVAASAFTYISISAAGTGTISLSSGQQGFGAYEFTGALTGNRTINFPTTVAEYIVTNSTSGAYTLTIKTAAGTGIVVPAAGAMKLYCDGTNIRQGVTGSVSIPVAIADGGTGATTANGALTNLGGTSVGTAVFGAATKAVARSAIDVGAAGASDIWTATSTTTVISPSALIAATAIQTLTDGATIAWDLNTGFNFQVTLGGNRTLNAPTNAKDGQSGVLYIVQDGTGSRTLTFNSAYKFPGAAAPTLSTAAGAVDRIFYMVRNRSGTLTVEFSAVEKAIA